MHLKTISACQAVGEIVESNQDETDGSDATKLDPYPLGSGRRESESQSAWWGELLPLPQFEANDGKGQSTRGTTTAHALDEAPQGETQRNRQGRPISGRGALRALRAIQGSNGGRLETGACLGMKNIGKPGAGEPRARFDEG